MDSELDRIEALENDVALLKKNQKKSDERFEKLLARFGNQRKQTAKNRFDPANVKPNPKITTQIR